MTPHERELILETAGEIRSADRSVIDPEAERLIRSEIASQRNAAYLLAQRVIVQQLALRQARERIDELERKAGGAGRSFLPGASGGAGPTSSPPTGYAAQGGGGPGPQPSSGGGAGSFLRTAAAAAAGTIGGQLIYDGIRHWSASHEDRAGGWVPGSAGSSGFSTGGGRPSASDSAFASPGGEAGGGGDFDDDSSTTPQNSGTGDWGGGGDFNADPVEEEEDVESVAELDDEPEADISEDESDFGDADDDAV